jgi:hypothetical protein
MFDSYVEVELSEILIDQCMDSSGVINRRKIEILDKR